MIYKLADIFFFTFHILFIVFNLFGWLLKPFRKWNLLTLGLTAFSWFFLGIFYGWGYCVLTDWHWQIRERLGLENPYNSYVQFLIFKLFNIHTSGNLVDTVTAVSFLLALIGSIVTNTIDWRKRKTRHTSLY